MNPSRLFPNALLLILLVSSLGGFPPHLPLEVTTFLIARKRSVNPFLVYRTPSGEHHQTMDRELARGSTCRLLWLTKIPLVSFQFRRLVFFLLLVSLSELCRILLACKALTRKPYQIYPVSGLHSLGYLPSPSMMAVVCFMRPG